MAADVSSVEVSGRTFILTDRPSALFKNGRRNTNKPTFLDLTNSEAAGDLVIGRFALLWQYRRHFAPEDQCNAGVYQVTRDNLSTTSKCSSLERRGRFAAIAQAAIHMSFSGILFLLFFRFLLIIPYSCAASSPQSTISQTDENSRSGLRFSSGRADLCAPYASSPITIVGSRSSGIN